MRRMILIVVFLTVCACSPRSDDGGRSLIQNKGSDSMAPVALAWAEAYEGVVPEVGIAVTSGGSGTGISALLNGTVDIANATREMTDDELRRARELGIEPIKFAVGYDAPAFIVHEDNPLRALRIDQLAEIYGEGGTIDQWSQLGTTVPGCDSDEIIRGSRQNSSGTYVYLRRKILGSERDYKLGSMDMQGSMDVVTLVSRTPCAIGYTALAYASPTGVRIPCIETLEGGSCVTPSIQSAVDGTYLLARPLLMYTSGVPKGRIREFIDWVLSDEGQCILRERGYAPLRPVFCP